MPYRDTQPTLFVKKCISWTHIDQEAFVDNISKVSVDNHVSDVNESAGNVAEVLLTDLGLSDDVAENAAPNLNIPVLADAVTTDEVALQIRKMNANKACSPDETAPGVFKLLPVN
ncbi:hypothetical protein E2C01_055067 [Portunus trituberculatus]|uniref:Uncharacterized protein n=1 Tax=Portunus trituberculatus TaxID=210409 RepID=A0A5B7GUA9_PORTR|nr:hypothetical protein [Portunus trituberculatus]